MSTTCSTLTDRVTRLSAVGVGDASEPLQATATSTTLGSLVKILEYVSWILPLLVLIITVVIFFIQQNKYNRQKALEQKKIEYELKQMNK